MSKIIFRISRNCFLNSLNLRWKIISDKIAKQKTSSKRKFFAGTASYLKENKISSLVFFFVHFPAFIFAPIVLG
jgi:hypothetical protein